jgi:hypothetical protein
MKNDKQGSEYNETHDNNPYNKQPKNTKLTQFCKQSHLTWNHACQNIVVEIQSNCETNND